ncbi:MAG: hypothetical protein QOH46_2794 [Solirubrobacteraceae bacterium]|nr:hypothetical protein [Solirubrobacteraceae bacterium]
MHSSRELTASSFALTIDGGPAGPDRLLPGFTDADRLGLVVRRPCGGMGASGIVLVAVTAFYAIQRSRCDDFVIYPDYFVFHVGRPLGRHNTLDVYPPHKEVVVPDDPEELLRAINDRGITRLVVEDGMAGEDVFAPETLSSARARIVEALAYGPNGRVRDADVTIAGNDVTEGYVASALEQSDEVDAVERERITGARRQLVEDGRVVETYRRIGVDEALGLLAPQPERRLAAV